LKCILIFRFQFFNKQNQTLMISIAMFIFPAKIKIKSQPFASGRIFFRRDIAVD